MANHVRNSACPKCRELGHDKSGNNLGEYDDGSCYCWKCGYYIHATAYGKVGAFRKSYGNAVVQQNQRYYPLPNDVDVYVPAVARLWLGKYGLTEYEIVTNRLMWSEYWQQLIFPYFDKYNNLVGWQGRSFRPADAGKAYPKWFTQGDVQKLYHILPPKENYDTIVLVEDIVSAIKVSRHIPCMPIFGSTALNRLKTLYNRTTGLVWWLDPNMKKKSILEAFKARSIGMRATTIFSEKDPKEHSDNEIRKLS